MASHKPPSARIVAIHADAPAENLFFAQFRAWMAGYCSRDIFAWDFAWDALRRCVCEESAKALYSEFHLFARTLNDRAGRAIEWRPDVCRCLYRDEYLALCLVAASQRGDVASEFSAASELLGTDHVHALLMASRSLAQAMKVRKIALSPIGSPAKSHGRPARQLH
jgi:hypothetical protein